MTPEFSSTICLSLNGIAVEELPLPILSHGFVRIQTIYSCVSAGTESTSVSNLKLPLIARALEKPDQLGQLISVIRDRGVRRTLSLVNEKKAAFTPLGYSCVGKVVEVNSSSNYRLGDLIACGGVSYASHGTYNTVPESLCTFVSPYTDLRTASTVALGSISLHAFRRSECVLGSNLLIIGLGPLGVLAAEIASSAGCNVVGFDISNQRVELASSVLPSCQFYNTQNQSFSSIKNYFESYFDASILSASSKSTSLMDECCYYLSKKAKLVILGDVPIQCDRSSIYKKEIDLLISTSYGPGRYDSDFEEQNIKYPQEYVRWTESENFKAYIQLVSQNKISSVKKSCMDIEQVDYHTAVSNYKEKLFLLIKYPDIITEAELTTPKLSTTKLFSTNISIKASPSNQLVVDFIGLSSYLKTMIMPYLKPFKSRNALLYRNCYSSSPSNASSFGKFYKTKPFSDLDVFYDSSFSSSCKFAIIASAHSDHCNQICRALAAGYIVYCEKPMCLNQFELDSIASYFSATNQTRSFILLGYNRRFSPHTQRAKNFILMNSGGKINSTRINYKVNIKPIRNHPWLSKTDQGSRNVGETCHMYDFCNGFFDSIPLSVEAINLQATSPSESFVVVLRYPDDNVAVVTYALTSNIPLPKEHILIQSESCYVEIIDFRRTILTNTRSKIFTTHRTDKGQKNMWTSYVNTLLTFSPPPITFQELYSASTISFHVDELLK